jgi:hypothetical protein
MEMTLPSKTSEIYGYIQAAAIPLTKGKVLSIDPSIGSSSSQPAYASYLAGELQVSDTGNINPKLEKWWKLQELSEWIGQLYAVHHPDVVIFEDIPDQMYGIRGNATAHASLLKAVGAILSVPGPELYVPLRPQVWKARVPENYTKGDIQDAEEMGRITISMARELLANQSTGNKRGRK